MIPKRTFKLHNTQRWLPIDYVLDHIYPSFFSLFYARHSIRITLGTDDHDYQSRNESCSLPIKLQTKKGTESHETKGTLTTFSIHEHIILLFIKINIIINNMFANMPHAMNQQDVIATVEVMLQQEQSYIAADYLHQEMPQALSINRPQSLSLVDLDCRTKMSEWCYQVVDFCKFNRETVSIAMNFLDRYLSTPAGSSALNDRKVFQLAAMTCLYTAIKTFEPEAMEPKIVAGLSRGTYTEKQVTDMELSILNAIQWRMNPPTPLAFVHHFLALMEIDESDAVFELAKFQTELAVNEYSFIGLTPSSIAFAAIANALQDISPQCLHCMSTIANLDMVGNRKVQEKLYHTVQTSSTGRAPLTPMVSTKATVESNSGAFHVSPRGVTCQQ